MSATDKTALVAFQGDPICFIHVLLNALDLDRRSQEVAVVLEGQATGLIPDLARTDHPLNQLYLQAKERNLIDAVCRACAAKMGTLEAAEKENLKIVDDMSGHVGLAGYLERGYHIITF